MKRFTSIIIILLLLSVFTNTAFATDYDAGLIVSGYDSVPCNPEGRIALLMDTIAAQDEDMSKTLTRSAFAVITVNVVCDEEWQAENSNWSTLATNAVELADDYLFTEFNINFSGYSVVSWNSDNSNADADLLDEAIAERGLFGHDYMFAFTAQSNCQKAGWGKNNQPYALVIDQGASNNKVIAQHEIGHNYNLAHCTSNCVMNGTSSFYQYYEQYCSNHYNSMLSRWNRYGTIS